MTTLDFPATLLHRLRHARHIAVLTGGGHLGREWHPDLPRCPDRFVG